MEVGRNLKSIHFYFPFWRFDLNLFFGVPGLGFAYGNGPRIRDLVGGLMV